MRFSSRNFCFPPSLLGFVWLCFVAPPQGHVARAQQPASSPIVLPIAPVDIDDDDYDHIRDRTELFLPIETRVDLVEITPLPKSDPEPWPISMDTPYALRLVRDGRALTGMDHSRARWGPALYAQGLLPGHTSFHLGASSYVGRFVEARLLTNTNQPIDPVHSGVDIARAPPERLPSDPFAPVPTDQEDTFRSVLIGDRADIEEATLTVRSFTAEGKRLDALLTLATQPIPCPPDVASGLVCRSTLPLRLVLDEVDRLHPLSSDRSLVGELGGAVTVSLNASPNASPNAGGSSERKLVMVRVLGPRSTGVGPLDRYRAKLRVFLVRDRPQGGPPFGANDASALRLAREQIVRTNTLWGQCGVSFGPVDEMEMHLVDPPQKHMLALGCDLGLPASGGDLHMKVDGHEVRTVLRPGELPRSVARRLATAISAIGFSVRVSDNTRIGPGASASTDLLIRRRNKEGSFAVLEPPARGSISKDATFNACLGSVDLSDGLQHFSDMDAVAGTVEERALLKAFDDGDPRTIEVIFIPSFATGGRIGESFIHGDQSSLVNMILEDRAGVRADRISFALAHELGHILLDLPGHADDFGVDTPTRLMDSDAADPSAFGPRRITAEECTRVMRESGPESPVPLLTPWPLTKLVLQK